MDIVTGLIDLLLHLDQHLAVLTASYGYWIYALLFAIVFCETGLVVTPFLPGDSLLFVAGTIVAAGSMNVHLLVVLLILAAFLGDGVNYAVGAHFGPRIFHEKARFLKTEYLDRAHAFYLRHGGKTVVLARFIPIIRTYAPFVAGMGRMPYRSFALFNFVGGILWVGSLTYAGYFFGSLPWVKQNLSLVLIGIILLSISPAIVEYLRARRQSAA
jgi:membrane-associated protein